MNHRDPATAAQRHLSLGRRQFLRGMGACVALPLLESAFPRPLRAAATTPLGATGTSGAPVRMAYVYFPNGAHQANWWPTGAGSAFQLGPTLQALNPLKSSLQVLGGLNHENAKPGNDGAGDHARANATFLTGARARKTASTDIHVGVSIDQVIAQQVGHLTRFPSLELSCDHVRKSGNCDSGYSCAYQYNLSWQAPGTPMAPEPNPRLVFERLFGSGPVADRQRNFQQRQATQRSLLDLVQADARALGGRLDPADRSKLDEYLTGLREIELRIERAEKLGALPEIKSEAPAGIPPDFGEHMDIMYELLAMAFETDSTRIATLLLAGDGNNRAYPQIGIPEGHHYCSHHRNDHDLMGKIAAIDRYYVDHFAKFLLRLERTKDRHGQSLLHNSMIVYGCGNSDGNRHTHDNLPILLAGGGGGTLQTGRYLQSGGVPATNLFLSLADRVGAKGLERFGDSSGRLAI